ncbi:NAD(P)-dependent alcohol dehydrogenase [Pectobacterium carotovorum subsp. carotovorum]|uniref:zinc-dependent alcohol dehydrogenase family protein n=1 Tax=Pectobacterium carotovorum TaxID=554 RepID=UPI0013738E63|nr:NAD(P)-dependent alcohol dehydrogenase [Pectobacterium carotovorum]QHP54817.1 NAD(P)-dependent alcohol dehydrogenase [Pectobacterium carotovorum subsp. carotovorum]
MKAYRLDNFTSIDDLRVQSENVTQPQQGEVLVRVHAVSLNFRDIAILRGQYPAPHLKGLIPTSDGAGEVIAVGPGVDYFNVGDRVMGAFHPRWFAGQMPTNLFHYGYGSLSDGWLVEQKVVSQESLVRIPDNLSYEEASTLPCAALTAWSALTDGSPVRSGDTVLIQGTGGVSIFALQLAKAVGASVIATTSSAEKAELLRELGAEHVVNYREELRWGDRVRALSNGQGVDRIVEVGGPGTIAESLRAIRPGGDIALIGFVSSGGTSVDYIDMFMSGATLRHISVGSREALKDLSRAIAMADIKPIIDRVFDFEEAKQAFAYLDSRSHFGKVVIRCS